MDPGRGPGVFVLFPARGDLRLCLLCREKCFLLSGPHGRIRTVPPDGMRDRRVPGEYQHREFPVFVFLVSGWEAIGRRAWRRPFPVGYICIKFGWQRTGENHQRARKIRCPRMVAQREIPFVPVLGIRDRSDKQSLGYGPDRKNNHPSLGAIDLQFRLDMEIRPAASLIPACVIHVDPQNCPKRTLVRDSGL
jgi:hypothetical protein